MFKKYNGHVCTSAMDYVEQALGGVPRGWNAKSRCRPGHGEIVEDIITELKGLESRMRRTAQAIGVLKEEESGMKTDRIETELMMELKRAQQTDGDQVEEKQVQALTEEISHSIVAPVDKMDGDCAITCAQEWARAVRAHRETLRKLPEKQRRTLKTRMCRGGRKLEVLPFAHLRQARNHRFGPLRTWPKWKAVKPLWKKMESGRNSVEDGNTNSDNPWEEVEWRPLASFANHHWRKLYALGGKCTSAGLRTARLGLGAGAPRGVLERIHVFNKGKG